jgi:hypothetical protein
MRSGLTLFAGTLLLSLASTSLNAKNGSIGIYAVIDEVKLAPDGPTPNLIRISGVFVVPVPMSSGSYKAPQRGCISFRIPSGVEQAARKDWEELKSVAGTGQVVGFAQYWVPNPDDPNGNPHHSLEIIVRSDSDTAPPDVYPLPNPKGIVTYGDKDDPDFDKIAELLHRALPG